MNDLPPNALPAPAFEASSSELLLLPDGRVLVHNLTPQMARVLHQLNPNDDTIKPRTAPEPRRRGALRPPIV